MKRCLITGGSGLIGSHLIRSLDDYTIFNLSRRRIGHDENLQTVQNIVLDLSKEWNREDLPTQIDAVIHLAQSEHFRDFPEQAENVFQVNTLSTMRLLDYAQRAGARTFIFASSGGIYGHGEQEFSEEVEISSKGNLGFYFGTKICSEVIAESYSPFMNIIVLRFFFVYGPGQRQNMLIPRLVQSVLSNKPLMLQGQNGLRINPTHVSDAVVAITRALAVEGSHKINVAGPDVLSLREIGEIIGKSVNKECKFNLQLDVKPRHLVGDIRKMSRLLSAPVVRFENGLKTILKEFTDE